MDNIWIILVSSLISGLIATFITIFFQKKSDSKKEKEEVFKLLMSHRYQIIDKDNVEVLNRVEVVFYKDNEVRECWRKFLNIAEEAAENPSKNHLIEDKYLKLLEAIAKNLKLKKIDWEQIKKYYYPQGLATQLAEEIALRKAQIAQACKEDNNSSRKLSNTELGIQFMLKAMESPNGLDKIIQIYNLSQKINNEKTI